MEIGVSISPKTELIEELKDIDEEFDFVEMPIGEQERPIEEIEVQKVRKVLDEKWFDLIVHLPFGQPVVTQVADFNEAEISYLERILEFSERLEARKAVLHPNIRYREDKDKVKEPFRSQLEKLNKISENKGIELCVENMPKQIHSAANNFDLAEIARDLEISLCFDTGHGYSSMGQEQMNEFLDENSDIISHLHLQDTRDSEDLHMPIKSGEINFSEIADNLNGFDGTATLEVFCFDEEYLEISRRKTEEIFGDESK